MIGGQGFDIEDVEPGVAQPAPRISIFSGTIAESLFRSATLPRPGGGEWLTDPTLSHEAVQLILRPGDDLWDGLAVAQASEPMTSRNRLTPPAPCENLLIIGTPPLLEVLIAVLFSDTIALLHVFVPEPF